MLRWACVGFTPVGIAMASYDLVPWWMGLTPAAAVLVYLLKWALEWRRYRRFWPTER